MIANLLSITKEDLIYLDSILDDGTIVSQDGGGNGIILGFEYIGKYGRYTIGDIGGGNIRSVSANIVHAVTDEHELATLKAEDKMWAGLRKEMVKP